MATRMKIYTAPSIILALWITFYMKVVMAQSVEMPMTVCIVTLDDPCACPHSNICEKAISQLTPEDIIKMLEKIEPSAGDYHPPEWTPEEQDMEHFE